jgi:hypothetical protein
MSKCEFNGCTNDAQSGARLCNYHLDQIDYPKKPIINKQIIDEQNSDELDIKLEELTNVISRSEQMMKLTETIMNSDMMERAINSFDSLISLNEESRHDLLAFISVNIVSAIIQEKANLLLRAGMIVEAFPNEQGLQEFIDFEIESLNSFKSDKQTEH